MRRVFLFVIALFALAFAGDVTTTDPPVTISGSTSEVTVNTTESSPTSLDTTQGITTESSSTKSEVINSTTTENSSPKSNSIYSSTTKGSSTKSVIIKSRTTTESSPTKSDAIDSTTADVSSTKSYIVKSSTTTNTASVPVESDKPSEDVPSNKIPSFQYFAVPFIPLNGLVQNYSGQYGVLPSFFGTISNSLSEQTERKQVKEPKEESKIQSVINSPAPASLPEFLQGITSMQELTQMVFREMLNQQRGNGTCGGFIELEGTKEINHKISWGLPPADVESCSWVIWAQGGGPITVDFPKESNAKFDDSLSSLWVLNVNGSMQYQKTLLKPGDVETFPTGFRGAKGYYPFVIVHMLVKETEPGQQLHLKFSDKVDGYWQHMRPNVTYLNETLSYGRMISHPAHPLSSRGWLERLFFMGQTPKGRRVRLRLEIFPNGLPITDSYTWIQVSWIDLDSFQIHQEKLSRNSSLPFVMGDLKPSTSFVVVFCSHEGSNVGRAFSLSYRYY